MPTSDPGSTSGWGHRGRARPPFAVAPAPGQESVWDYPRPPVLVPDARVVIVRCDGVEIVRTARALRLLETASPPTFYLPLADVRPGVVVPAAGASWCEWKGRASYWSVVTPDVRLERVGWSYADPAVPFAAIRDHVAFYASQLECLVNGERVRPQPGAFYGGWITDEVVGPFKGEPGTGGW